MVHEPVLQKIYGLVQLVGVLLAVVNYPTKNFSGIFSELIVILKSLCKVYVT